MNLFCWTSRVFFVGTFTNLNTKIAENYQIYPKRKNLYDSIQLIDDNNDAKLILWLIREITNIF